jgi:ribosome-associated toxin RatA of RatAB toxin-antitoxin module
MASASRTETFNVSQSAFFKAVTDYEAYPKLVAAVESVEVLNEDNEKTRARFQLNLVKRFSYVLDLYEKEPDQLKWELVESDIFKHNNGSWNLTSKGDSKVEVHYEIDVGLPVLAPKSIVNKMVNSGLPKMMRDFSDHAKNFES